ncbi:MAG TPA: hypothetical protein VF857_05115 [Spirochaetota bacterium]
MRPTFWNKERLNLLQKIADAARKNAGGKTLNWVAAYDDLKPQIKKALPEYSAHDLSKAWSKYKKVLQGYCYAAGCTKKRYQNHIYCKKCGEKNKLYVESFDMGRILSSKRYLQYKNIIAAAINEKSRDELASILLENFGSLPKSFRATFLSEKYVKEIKAKQRKLFKM